MSFAETADSELVGQLRAAERDLVSDRFQHSLGQLENTAQLRVRRRLIAKLLGELRRREMERGLPKGSLASLQVDALAPTGGEQKTDGGGFLSGIVDKLTQES